MNCFKVFSSFQLPGCGDNVALVHNGFCNDETNIAACGYDGGDCCGHNVNLDHCYQCNCFYKETCDAGVTNNYVGDGFCNDETNIAACDDSGDCCGHNVNVDHCSQCNCFYEETCDAKVTNNYVGDGYCDDETNVLECNFDDGDCCGPNITTTHCTECQCLEVIVPPSGNILFKYIILNLIPC